MYKRKEQIEIARVFDGEADTPVTGKASPGESCYLAALEQMREGAQATMKREHINDLQFSAFMQGIRDKLEQPEPLRKPSRFWAWASLTAAAFVLAFATFLMVSGSATNVTATVVEEATTEIQGANVSWYSDDDGDATVWVDVADGDVW